jgi:KDO2-lipid IV(A) lauroyltransferase
VTALLFRALALLPLPVLHALGYGFYVLAFHIVRWRVKLARANLAGAFPEKTAAERETILRDSYLNLARTVMEAIWGYRASGEELMKRVHFENPECIERYKAARQSVVLLTAHTCNWEWLLLECSRRLGAPLVAAYKPLSWPAGDRWIRDMRSRFGATMVPARDIVQHLITQRGQVKLMAMLADQSPSKKNDLQVWLPFFGQDTSFYQGPGWIGAKMGFDPVFLAMRPDGRGRYVVRFVPLTAPGERADPDRILRAYVHELERQVREHPAQYFWSYNRWKRSRRLYE